jgi:hypothetical protein
LAQIRDDFLIGVREYLGGDQAVMREAVHIFFCNYYMAKHVINNPSSFRVTFDKKYGGIHPGFTCTVLFDNFSEIFHVKTHHWGPNKSSSKAREIPDLREIFSYALLEKIQIGPECHFFQAPPNTSKTTLYIATKKIAGLIHMDALVPESPNIKVKHIIF